MILNPRFFRRLRLGLMPLFAGFFVAASDPATPPGPHPLVWDAMQKSVEAKPDEGAAAFKFNVTNKSDTTVEVLQIRTSCGCTVAEMPSRPWILAPGATGAFTVTVDFEGRHGVFSKAIFVMSSAGTQRLEVTVNIPESVENRRALNQQLALFNRQAVLQGECASCHATPAAGKSGAELFQAVCAMCHLANSRASVVPDLAEPRTSRDATFWRTWIAEGKEQTLMPAFAQKRGGPLTDDQIASLVAYALANFPKEPRRAAP